MSPRWHVLIQLAQSEVSHYPEGQASSVWFMREVLVCFPITGVSA